MESSLILELLFENPWLLAGLLVALQAPSLALWAWRRTLPWIRLVRINLAALVVLPLVSVLVVTQRERVIELCRNLAVMVEQGEISAIDRALANDFEAAGLDRFEFLERLEQRLKRYHIDSPKLRHFEVNFPGPAEASAIFDAACTVRSIDGIEYRFPSRWRLGLRQEGRVWRVITIEALPTPLSPLRDLRQYLP